jgi:hypothetical protein
MWGHAAHLGPAIAVKAASHLRPLFRTPGREMVLGATKVPGSPPPADFFGTITWDDGSPWTYTYGVYPMATYPMDVNVVCAMEIINNAGSLYGINDCPTTDPNWVICQKSAIQ